MQSIRRQLLAVSCAMLALFTTGCNNPAQPVVTDTPPISQPTATTALLPPTPTKAIFPTQTPFLPTAVSDPEQRPQLERPRYFLDVKLDYFTLSVDVQQVVIYTNRTGETLNELLFMVDAHRRYGVFTLEELKWLNGAPVENWLLDGVFLTVPLTEPLENGESVSLELDYHLQLPAERGKLGFSDNQLNLGDWYPVVAVYFPGQGWLAYPPHPVGETMVNESGDYEVRLEVVNAREGLLVAASLPAEREGDAYIYSGKALRSFAFSMSDMLEMVSTQNGGVEFESYFYPWDRNAGQTALEEAVKSLELFSELFGPYPHSKYTVVEGNFPDGLEFDGLAFTGREYYNLYDGTVKNYLMLITVHEAAHQWWFAQVGNNQAIEPWVDEALAIYSEYLYIESEYPELAEWWWQQRIDPFRPFGGAVNDPVYAHIFSRNYVNAVYLLGADMMQAIRQEIGDAAFKEALRTYLNDYKTKVATGDDLIQVFEATSGKNLDSILAVFFSNPQ